MDYDFSVLFQTLYSDKSVRQTELASVYRWINLSAMGLQIITGVFLVILRLRGTLVMIPTVLGGAITLFLLAPTLGLSVLGIMVFTKIASKAMDYSIFRATKELLYLPLSVRERVEGKAVVDVMGYRVAKGGASAPSALCDAIGHRALCIQYDGGVLIDHLVCLGSAPSVATCTADNR